MQIRKLLVILQLDMKVAADTDIRMSAGSWKRLPDKSVLALLLLYAFCLLVIAGRDGWLRMPMGYVDTYWYQMCGKAWMEGFMPYQDFTDSKGPLLWLIYGLGYLISPRNMYGMMPFEIFAYWINFYVLYRAALLVLKDTPRSLLASMAMALVYFYPGMHFEILTEDYCQPFFSLAFYILLQGFIRNRIKPRYALWLGISCGCTLMLKYSYFIVLLVPCGLIFFRLCVLKKDVSKCLLYYIAGILTAVAPFIIYFLVAGLLDSFVTEYFVNTLKTIFEGKEIIESEHNGLIYRWPFNIWYLYRHDHFLSEYMRFSLLCMLVTVYKFRRYGAFVLSLVIWYVGCVLLYATINQVRYYLSMSVIFFGGILWLTGLIRGLKTDEAVMGGALILSFIAVIVTFYVYSEFYHIKINYRTNVIFDKVSGVINEVEHQIGRAPTITFLETADYGETTATNALPGTKYWARQFGMTREMRRHHWEDIKSQRPDLVITDSYCQDGREMLEKAGYRLLLTYHEEKLHKDVPPEPRYLYINEKINSLEGSKKNVNFVGNLNDKL